MSENNGSGTNTVLIVILLLLVVGGGAWLYFNGMPGSQTPSQVDVNVSLPSAAPQPE